MNFLHCYINYSREKTGWVLAAAWPPGKSALSAGISKINRFGHMPLRMKHS
jgi:hypothetical protein